MTTKAKSAKAAKSESDAAKAKRAARDKARREAAKAAKKTPAKKAPAKKAPAKKAAKVAKPAAAKKSDKPAPKVVTGHKAGTLPGDVTKHGVLMPREGTQARKLWDICDGLKSKLGRPPARFEFRKAIQGMTGADGSSPINADSASFQYFAWRKFHGVKGRSIGIYPKRNTFEANTPEPAKKAAKRKK